MVCSLHGALPEALENSGPEPDSLGLETAIRGLPAWRRCVSSGCGRH